MGFLDRLKFPTFSEKYEFGLPDIKGEKSVIIQFFQNEVEFKFILGFTTKKVIFKPNDIIEVGLNQESFRSAGKAATGAIIGGVLTGGIGFIAGAALGGKRRKENQLYLLVKYMGMDCEIVIKPSKYTPLIYSELKKLSIKQKEYPTQYSSNEMLSKTDNATQIEKLHELYLKGILTQEEFSEQKKKLLS